MVILTFNSKLTTSWPVHLDLTLLENTNRKPYFASQMQQSACCCSVQKYLKSPLIDLALYLRNCLTTMMQLLPTFRCFSLLFDTFWCQKEYLAPENSVMRYLDGFMSRGRINRPADANATPIILACLSHHRSTQEPIHGLITLWEWCGPALGVFEPFLFHLPLW